MPPPALNYSWSVEVHIPYSVLKVAGMPQPGDARAFQFGRQQKALAETSTWTVTSGFSAAPRFGEVVFR